MTSKAKRAGAPGITEIMLDAGETAIWERLGGADLGGHFCARELARSVYLAMACAKKAKPRELRADTSKAHRPIRLST